MYGTMDLQLFAEGGEGASPAASTDGAQAAPSHRERLTQLGVPTHLIDRQERRQSKGRKVKQAPAAQDNTVRVQMTRKDVPAASGGNPSRHSQARQSDSLRRHMEVLNIQGNAMKDKHPDFDLRREMQDPRFVRLTAPGSGVSVEDAHFLLHRQELMDQAAQSAAKEAAQRYADSVQAGQRRPVENGIAGQAATVTTFDYKNASRQQRAEFKKKIYDAAARGEKIYPGQ
ncbi:MAG: hypothetical protein J6J04_05245 [Oscillospiraceae bacterium]|nr:hypothetical protein [Oscillospiraceae bacterium]